jgi:3-methyl-2-oxobutanoate hydroxymethyltransferase
MSKVTTTTLLEMKQQSDKITCLTAYDASFAKLFDEQGIDVILIGDSLGMVLKGEEDTLGVTTADIAYHTQSVRKSVKRSFVVADMPFMSYSSIELACENAATLMAAGANMVKLEGGGWLASTVRKLNESGVPVCGHLGLTPQSVNVLGGFKVQGKTDEQAEHLIEQARLLAEAGIQLLVLECVPSALADTITRNLNIPTIGIGAGKLTDGQVLVMHDMLGVSANYMPKFSKNYLEETGDIRKAVQRYIEQVRHGHFPDDKHSFS